MLSPAARWSPCSMRTPWNRARGNTARSAAAGRDAVFKASRRNLWRCFVHTRSDLGGLRQTIRWRRSEVKPHDEFVHDGPNGEAQAESWARFAMCWISLDNQKRVVDPKFRSANLGRKCPLVGERSFLRHVGAERRVPASPAGSPRQTAREAVSDPVALTCSASARARRSANGPLMHSRCEHDHAVRRDRQTRVSSPPVHLLCGDIDICRRLARACAFPHASSD